MKSIRLKVCGLRDNVEEVASLRPDYVGFIFYPKSPRYVGEDFVMPEIDALIDKVGVFVNEPVDRVIELVKRYKLDFVQLHGNESVDMCKELKEDGLGVIKAFAMDDDFNFAQLEQYDSSTDYFLFDTKTRSYGGSGEVFNWEILKKYQLDKAYFLSGGISLDNLEGLESIDLSKVHALDVNSRFEVRPGLKDVDLLKKLKENINN